MAPNNAASGSEPINNIRTASHASITRRFDARSTTKPAGSANSR
jgi:hypothetical protein